MPAPSRRSTTVMSPALRNSSARPASLAIFAYRGRYAASTRSASSSDLPLLSQPGQSNAEATATGFFLPRSTITRIALAMCATLPLRHSEGPVSFVTRLSLHLGAVVVLGVVLVFGAGLYAASQVQQDLLPDISIPAVIVITPYPGASPDIVDTQVTVPVVNALQGVTGADTVQSTSSQGVSLAIVLFKDGTDLKAAQQDINAALARAKPFLPPQAPASTVQTFSTNSTPILTYAVSADEPLGDLAGQLRAQALPKLKGLTGVSSLVITGAPTDEVDVILDPAKLATYGVTSGQVAAALQQASIVQSIGSLKDGSATIPLQVSGSLTSLDQIGKVTVNPPLGAPSGGKPPAPVSINQLGTVQIVSIPADTITRTNGKQSIGLQIVKGPNTNTVTVANEVWNAL